MIECARDLLWANYQAHPFIQAVKHILIHACNAFTYIPPSVHCLPSIAGRATYPGTHPVSGKYSHLELTGCHIFIEHSGEGTGDDLTLCERADPFAVSKRAMCRTTTLSTISSLYVRQSLCWRYVWHKMLSSGYVAVNCLSLSRVTVSEYLKKTSRATLITSHPPLTKVNRLSLGFLSFLDCLLMLFTLFNSLSFCSFEERMLSANGKHLSSCSNKDQAPCYV